MRNKIILKTEKRAKDSQLGYIERRRLIEHGNKIGINEILQQNERKSLKLKSKI